MRIAVLGGSGVVGRHVVEIAAARGHEATACSRRTGVDLVTGAGLDSALEGVAVAIDVSTTRSVRRGPAREFFEAAARHLQAACSRQGVAHVIVLSIVGIDQLRAWGYYDAKLTQERLNLDGPVGVTVLRATQFHEFPGQLAARSTVAGVTAVPDLLVQTVAARSAAEALVDVAGSDGPTGRGADLAGPGPPARLPALVRATLERDGRRARVLGVRVPGAMGRAVRDGALLPPPDAHLVGPTFEAWLKAR